MTEIRKELQPNEVEDAAVRWLRLIRIGLRNQDKEILEAVRDDLKSKYGRLFGEKVFDELLFIEAMEINQADLIRDDPELKGQI